MTAFSKQANALFRSNRLKYEISSPKNFFSLAQRNSHWVSMEVPGQHVGEGVSKLPGSTPPEHMKDTCEAGQTAPEPTIKQITRRIFGLSKSTSEVTNVQSELDDLNADAASTRNVALVQQRWNQPSGNIPRLGFAFMSFMIAGMNDAAVGALIPYLEEYYNLNYTLVSLMFLTPFAGYSTAAFANATIHTKFGQRGIAFAAPICHIITYVVISVHPPFPVVVAINIISGFGNGLTDACFSAWVGGMHNPNSVQGLLHSCYSIGALFAPLIATSMIVKSHLHWYTFYYVMVRVMLPEVVKLTL